MVPAASVAPVPPGLDDRRKWPARPSRSHRVAGPHPVERPARPSARRVGPAGHRRIGRCRSGLRAPREIHGPEVVALTRSAQKGAKLKELGADFVFDPQDANLSRKASNRTRPTAVDLAIDNVAGPLFNQVVATLGYGGKISVVGRSAGPVPEFNTGTLFFRRNRIGGVAVGDYTPETAQVDWKKIVAVSTPSMASP